ncbi:MAG: glycerate kinase [Anaerolineae bacterium]|nr:glycerate kinase [Anaerolineae bacterium]
MKILIAPNAFKNSLTQIQVADAIANGLRRSGLDADLHLLPMADGGNGTLDAFLAHGGQRIEIDTLDPIGRPIKAAFGLLADNETAVIEMALASGLELLRHRELAPLRASTYGTGLLMRSALDAGAKRIIIGLGGSATTDGGAGCFQALGTRFLDGNGHTIDQGGGALRDLAVIDNSNLDARLRGVEVIIASDVDNLAVGPRGAAAVYGPQKGASPVDVQQLEVGLQRLFELVHQQMGVDVRTTPGGGAAGAFAAGLMAFANGRIQSGVDLILDYHHFDDLLQDAALVLTGEGRIDSQTLSGKGPFGIARRAALQGVRTIALVGTLDVDEKSLHAAGIWSALPIVPRPMSLRYALKNAAALVENAALRLGYLLQLSAVK